MAKKTKTASPAEQLHEELQRVVELVKDVAGKSSPRSLGKVRAVIDEAAAVLQEVHQDLDLVKLPGAIFDPSNPQVVGRFVAMALLAQERQELSSIGRFYGSGVYALYYKGELPIYGSVANTDHPIYVGKADPALQTARTPVEQGEKLAGRLSDHRKSILKGKDLAPEDFECRFLVVSSGWQEAAESHLIHLYRPIWNSETGICYGIGKHGDSAEKRSNDRSPWDTLHPGRKWADNPKLVDSKSPGQIADEITAHFAEFPPLRTREEAVELMLKEMSQG